MIYTMGAFGDCIPVNMNIEPQVEKEAEPEFTVTHLDNNSIFASNEQVHITDDQKSHSFVEDSESQTEIKIITIDMKNKFEGGNIGKVYTGEPLHKPDVHI